MRDAEGPAELRPVLYLRVVVREHRPEAFEDRARDGDAELRHVALEEGADEVAPPAIAVGMAAGRVGRREPAAQPEAIRPARSDFGKREPGQLVVGDASGQRLGALAQQVRRGAAEDEKPCGPPWAVRQDPQARKEIGTPLNLVDDYETSKRRQGEERVREAGHVGGRLDVEDVGRSFPAARHLAGQGRLADLTCPEES